MGSLPEEEGGGVSGGKPAKTHSRDLYLNKGVVPSLSSVGGPVLRVAKKKKESGEGEKLRERILCPQGGNPWPKKESLIIEERREGVHT